MKHVRIKIARRNTKNIRYADDIDLMAENEEELKSFLMRVKDEKEKGDIKLNFQKPNIMTSGLITSSQKDRGKVEIDRFHFLVSKITLDNDCSPEIQRHLPLGKKAMSNLVVAVLVLPSFVQLFCHGISQARILEKVAISLSRGSSWSRDWTHVFCIESRFFTIKPVGKHW